MAGKAGGTKRETAEQKAAKCGMTLAQWRAAQHVAQISKSRGRKAPGTGVDFSAPVAGQLDMFGE